MNIIDKKNLRKTAANETIKTEEKINNIDKENPRKTATNETVNQITYPSEEEAVRENRNVSAQARVFSYFSILDVLNLK